MFETKRCKVINSCWDPRGISGNESQVWQHPLGWAEHIAQAVAQLPVIILKRGLLNPATIKFGVPTPQPNPGWPPSCKRPSTALTPTWRRWTRLTLPGLLKVLMIRPLSKNILTIWSTLYMYCVWRAFHSSVGFSFLWILTILRGIPPNPRFLPKDGKDHPWHLQRVAETALTSAVICHDVNEPNNLMGEIVFFTKEKEDWIQHVFVLCRRFAKAK